MREFQRLGTNLRVDVKRDKRRVIEKGKPLNLNAAERKKKAIRKRLVEDFRTAMVLEFNSFYGTDDNDTSCWWGLCNALRIRSPPDTLTTCQKVVKSKYVNIIDFVEAKRRGGKVIIYPTLSELRKNTIDNEMYFPLKHAKTGNVLVGLLQHMHKSRDVGEYDHVLWMGRLYMAIFVQLA
ncbi:hypothetical protein QCA50_006354 [Cerrena zonata]|uniref:Uncharacterized protein n=1 Tax=Cerrena zonata TaxID=2478898 RepID=A0AAW0G8E5_9APHY